MQITESLLKSIMDQYNVPLYYMCLSIVKRTDSAHDIVMESFEKLWFMRDQVPYEKVKAFLFMSAKNRCIDVYRNQNWESDRLDNMIIDQRNDPTRAIDGRDMLIRALKVIRGMQSRKSRINSIDIFINTYVHDLPSKDIGSVSMVTSMRGYMIGKLRQAFAKEII